MNTLARENVTAASKKREPISVTQVGKCRFYAEIPERWGKRFLGVEVRDNPNQQGCKEAVFTITYIKNDGTESSPGKPNVFFDLYPAPNTTDRDLVELVVNKYFNSDWWILRALRA
jgi:hypothetical protein